VVRGASALLAQAKPALARPGLWPASLLGLAAGAAYFLLAGELPASEAGRGAVAAAAGALAVALCAFAPLAGRDEPVGIVVFGVGAALLAVALNARDVGAAATPVEALVGASAGLLFAYAFGVPTAVVALPVIVAGIDAASLLGGGPRGLPAASADPDVLTLDLPRWGGGGDVARLGLLDAVFLALFAAWSVRFALRPRLALPLMALGLAGAAALSVAVDRALPTLPFLALAFLSAIAPGIPRLLAGSRSLPGHGP
jgi:hypothetical protein